MSNPVTSIELARKLMKTWDLPKAMTNITISIGVDKSPEVTVSYLVSQEDAAGFLHLIKHYNLVENELIRTPEV